MKLKLAEKTEITASNRTDIKLYLTRGRIEMYEVDMHGNFVRTQSTTRSQVQRVLKGKTNSFSILFEYNLETSPGFFAQFTKTGKTFRLGCCYFRGKNLAILRRWALAKKATQKSETR